MDRSPAATIGAQSEAKFNAKWQKLASTLACVELNGGKEYNQATLNIELLKAFERHIDLILEGEFSCNFIIDSENTFVVNPKDFLKKEKLMEMMTGEKVQRNYKDLKTQINNHFTPMYLKRLNVDGTIPSGKQKRDILFETCKEYYERHSSSKNPPEFSMIKHEPLEFLTFQLLGIPSDRCISEFNLRMSRGPSSTGGELLRTPELSRASKRKFDQQLSSPGTPSSSFNGSPESNQSQLLEAYRSDQLLTLRRDRIAELDLGMRMYQGLISVKILLFL